MPCGLLIFAQTLGQTEFTAWDLGGHEAVRELWQDYFTEVDGVVFVVDSSDVSRFREAQYELSQVLKSPNTADTPIAILGNKSDVKTTVSREELIAYLQLNPAEMVVDPATMDEKTRAINVFKCSLLEGSGYQEALQWLVNAMGSV
mmetsp:Transcript_17825/g.41998  ORF Transcript_17825/g.41998 Transcript_17825/m.41998 type:complete len:146 (+) Transcript_17825:239-676(+)